MQGRTSRTTFYAGSVTSTAKNSKHGSGREALLRATVRVAAKRGLRGLTLRAVAEEAGVNNTLIVHYFGSRENLLSAALAWSVDQSITAVNLSDFSHDSVAFRDALIAFAGSEQDTSIFQYEMILESSRRAELRPAVKELYRAFVTTLSTGLLRSDGPVEPGLSLAMFAALDGLVLQFLCRSIDAEQFADAMNALIIAVNWDRSDARGEIESTWGLKS